MPEAKKQINGNKKPEVSVGDVTAVRRNIVTFKYVCNTKDFEKGKAGKLVLTLEDIGKGNIVCLSGEGTSIKNLIKSFDFASDSDENILVGLCNLMRGSHPDIALKRGSWPYEVGIGGAQWARKENTLLVAGSSYALKEANKQVIEECVKDAKEIKVLKFGEGLNTDPAQDYILRRMGAKFKWESKEMQSLLVGLSDEYKKQIFDSIEKAKQKRRF